MNRGALLGAAYALFDEIVWIAGLNASWLLHTLLGGVVFGIAPSTMAASVLVRARAAGEKVRLLRDFTAAWTSGFRRANGILIPGMLALVGVGLTSRYLASRSDLPSMLAAGGALVILVAFAGVLSIAVTLDANYSVAARAVIPAALRFAIANPLLLFSHLLVLGAVGLLTALIPGVLPFFSIGLVSYLTTRISHDFFARNEKRLADAAVGPHQLTP